jgi:hypothetical protein
LIADPEEVEIAVGRYDGPDGDMMAGMSLGLHGWDRTKKGGEGRPLMYGTQKACAVLESCSADSRPGTSEGRERLIFPGTLYMHLLMCFPNQFANRIHHLFKSNLNIATPTSNVHHSQPSVTSLNPFQT